MTIEEVMALADEYANATADVATGLRPVQRRTAAEEELRAAILALLDAEAWACQSVVHSSLVGVMTCDANGHPVTEYVNKHEAIAAIRARIAARKGGSDD
jgi:hypothetical protein